MLISLHGRALALRPVAARDQAERAGRGGRRHRTLALEDASAMMLSRRDGGGRRRALCGGAAGRDAAHRVRHARLGAGADRHAVRRRRHVLGAGDRRGDPGPARRDAARRARPHPSGHPGRRLRRRHHRRSSWSRPRASTGGARPLMARRAGAPPCTGRRAAAHRRRALRRDRSRARRPSAAPILRARELSRAFGGLKAVDEVSSRRPARA